MTTDMTTDVNAGTAPDLHAVLPADLPATAYSRRMIEALRQAGCGLTIHALPGPHPRIDPSAILAGDIALSRLPDGAAVLLDGSALFNLASTLPLDDRRLRFVALVERVHTTDPPVSPVAPSVSEAAIHRHLEEAALALMRCVLVPDDAVASDVAALGVRPERLIHAAADGGGARRLLAALAAPAEPRGDT